MSLSASLLQKCDGGNAPYAFSASGTELKALIPSQNPLLMDNRKKGSASGGDHLDSEKAQDECGNEKDSH